MYNSIKQLLSLEKLTEA